MDLNKELALKKLQVLLEKLFEIDPVNVTPEASLYEDLDLDSIDAIDLIIHLQEMTKRKFNPEEFKSVKTVDDVLTIILTILSDDITCEK